jgi:hypothetical protein
MVRKQTRKRRGGGLGANTATWPPDNSAFGRFVGSPLNADNLPFEKSVKGGKRRRSRKTRRRRRGGDPIPDRNQFEARTYEVKPKDSSTWKGYDTHKIETKTTGKYDLYKNKIPLKK